MTLHHVGTMRRADLNMWANDRLNLELAHETFGTPIDDSVEFSEVEGVWWWVLGCLWPRSNFIRVWVDDGDKP